MDNAQVLALLQTGAIEVEGRVSWGSNYTLLGNACADDAQITVVYKPRRGERPLWDFPAGTLCQREVAAYLVSAAAGWHIVPPTVLRKGPYGIGSVQLFIDHDPNIHYFNIQGQPQYDAQLQRIVLFDWITNNADRKGGHILLGDADRLWAIDHGICFHTDYKLRSVIWDFAGRPIPADQIAELETLLAALDGAPLRTALTPLLSAAELAALARRTRQLLTQGSYPDPGPGRSYPWPPV